MSLIIGLGGGSGSGKTTSYRDFPPEETFFALPNNKSLPWAGWRKNYKELNKDNPKGNLVRTDQIKNKTGPRGTKGLEGLLDYINDNRTEIKYLIIDDMTHYFQGTTLSPEFNAKKGFDKWNYFGLDVYEVIIKKVESLRDDLTVFLNFHIEPESSKDEKVKVKTPGKMLDNQVDIPSRLTYMLYTTVLPFGDSEERSERYKFVTNDDGYYPAKTSMGLFENLYIPNNMYEVSEKIRKYEFGE